MVQRKAEPLRSRKSPRVYVDVERRRGALCTPPTASLFMPVYSKWGANAQWKMFCFSFTPLHAVPHSHVMQLSKMPQVYPHLWVCKAVCMADKCVHHQNYHLRLQAGRTFSSNLKSAYPEVEGKASGFCSLHLLYLYVSTTLLLQVRIMKQN